MAQLSDAILATLGASDPRKQSIPAALPAVTGQPAAAPPPLPPLGSAAPPATNFGGAIAQTVQQGLGQVQDMQTPAPITGVTPLNDTEKLVAQIREAQAFQQRMKGLQQQPAQVMQAEGMIAGSPEKMGEMGYSAGEPTANYIDWVGNALKKTSTTALEMVGGTLDRPRQAIAAIANSFAEGNQWDRALKAGLVSQKYWFHNPNYISWRDVLRTSGDSEGDKYNLPYFGETSQRDIMGTALDFILDPINIASIGASKGASVLAKSGEHLAPAGREVLADMVAANRVADSKMHRWLEYIGRPDLAAAAEKLAPEIRAAMEDPSKIKSIKSANPNIAKVMRDLDETIVKASSNGKLEMPHPDGPIKLADGRELPRKVNVLELNDFLRAKASDTLADHLSRNPELAKGLTDPGGLKLFGKTVLPGRPITQGIKSGAKAATDALMGGAERTGRQVEGISDNLFMRKAGESIPRAAEGVYGLGETVGKAFSTVWGLPPAFSRYLQTGFYSRFKGVESKFRLQLHSIFHGTSYADRVAITKAIDSGTIDELLAKTPRLSGAVEKMRHAQDELFAEEAARGLQDPAAYRDNYIYHSYRNTKQAKTVLLARKPNVPSASILDPSTYQRDFSTLAEAEVAGLYPEYDAGRLLSMRLMNGWRSVITHDFEKGVVEKFGYFTNIQDGLKIAAKAEGEAGSKVVQRTDDALLAGHITARDPETSWQIANQLAIEGSAKLDAIKILPDDAKRHFFRDRFAIAARRGGVKEMANVSGKYANFKQFWPKGEANSIINDTFQLPAINKFDGPHVPLPIPGMGTAILPQRIAKKVEEVMNTSVFSSNAGESLRGLLGLYDKAILNPFRKINTVIWPSFQFRNAYTNVIQSSMDIGLGVLNPATNFEAQAILRGGGKGVRVATRHGVISGEQAMHEFLRYGGMNTFYKRAQITTASAATSLADDVVKDLAALPGGHLTNIIPHPVNTMRNIGTDIENHSRFVHFLALRKDGLDPASAMEHVHQFLFDYDNLTPADRELFRRLLPFWPWMKFNTKLQAEMAIRKPYIVGNYLKAFRGLQEDSKHPERGYLERQLMPAYLRSEWGVRIGQGNAPQTIKYILGGDLPQNDINNIWAGDMPRTLNRLVQSMGPIADIGNALYAMAGGDNSVAKGIDSGAPAYPFLRELLNKKDEIGYKQMAEFIDLQSGFDNQGRAIVKANPAKLKSLAVVGLMDRPLRELSRFVNPSSDSWTSALARAFTGVHFVEINPGQLERAKIDKGSRRLSDWLKTLETQANALYIKQGASPEQDPFSYGNPLPPTEEPE